MNNGGNIKLKTEEMKSTKKCTTIKSGCANFFHNNSNAGRVYLGCEEDHNCFPKGRRE